MMPITNNTLPLTGTGVLYNNQGDVRVVMSQDDINVRLKREISRVVDLDLLEFLHEFVRGDPQLSAAYITFKTRKRMGVK
jgi:hypothetical protein